MSKPLRYKVLSDDSGHDYFVLIGEEKMFYDWVESESQETDYKGPSYDRNRIDGRFTFTDPRCE